MKTLLGMINPFDLNQKFFVYESGNKIDNFTTTIDQLADNVLLYTKKYDIQEVTLSGSRHFLEGITREIQEQEIKNYSTNKLIFNYI